MTLYTDDDPDESLKFSLIPFLHSPYRLNPYISPSVRACVALPEQAFLLPRCWSPRRTAAAIDSMSLAELLT